MSGTEKRPYQQMMNIASAVAERLRPACHRIEIAGSLRRRKASVGDIEIVAIPTPYLNLLGEPIERTLVDTILDGWPITWAKRGEKYQQFSFAGTHGGIFTVDLFLQPDPATWAVNYLLRTGSAGFSHRMVTPKAQGGYKPDGYEVRDARVWRNGAALALVDEADIFELWGMAYVEPEGRV